jgi:hypothetical protein
MPIKAAVFFNSIVRPTVNEFLCDTGDLRRGFLAAIVLNHTADYWWLENKITYKDLSSLRVDLIQKCPEFSVIRDVADASKHGELFRASKQMSSSDQVKPEKVLRTDGISVFSPTIVMFTLDKRTSSEPLERPVRSVLSMWELSFK